MLRHKINELVQLNIPGFDTDNEEHKTLQYAFNMRDCRDWYNEYRNFLLMRLGAGFFPVFRFSDGECVFSLGYRLPPPGSGVNVVLHYVRSWMSAYIKYRRHRTFWSGTPASSYEKYVGEEWRSLRREFIINLQELSKIGHIAGCFCKHSCPSMMDKYIPDIFDWFEINRIDLSPENYVPFYFIYGILLRKDCFEFYKGRSVLVVTSIDDKKEDGIKSFLESNGASHVTFIPISKSSGMTERIALNSEHRDADIALIGAGVGAANILVQLRSTNALCVDAGFVLDCYANESLRGSRIYSRPD